MIEAIDLCKQFERSVKKENAAEYSAGSTRGNTEDREKQSASGRYAETGKKRDQRTGPGGKDRKNRKNSGRWFTGKTVKEEFLAVDHISLHADAGEIVGVLGPNGAGKTTLLRMLGMLMTPTSGRVALWEEALNGGTGDPVGENGASCADGAQEMGTQRSMRQITDPIRRKEAIGYLSGNTKLYPRFSIREYLVMMGELYGLSREEIEQRSEEIFDLLDMESFADNRIERLSTGQTQRASIARCLMADPSVYILDEPTLGLDILSADAIIRFMQSQKERGKTVLYSTHYLEEAQTLCDRIYMIDHGQVVAEGTPRELMEQTGTESLREAFHVIMETPSRIGSRADRAAN